MPFFSARPTAIFNIRGRGRLPFLVRQIITTGYVASGYKDGTPWKNVSSLNQSTDTNTNLGDLLQNPASYSSGAHNRDHAFIWSSGTAHSTAYNSTACFNMRNNTTLSKTSAMDTQYTSQDSGTMQDHDGYGITRYSWQNGKAAAAYIQRFNMSNETHSGIVATSFTQAGTGASAHFSEFWGYWWADNDQANRIRKFVFTTETESTPNFSAGFHGQQQGLAAKTGFGYAGNEGSYQSGYNFRKTSYATESLVGTMAKPIGNSGEENFFMGQDRGYAAGIYSDSAQNNRTYRFSYTTDTGYELGASAQPSAPGIAGRSSGHGYWRD